MGHALPAPGPRQQRAAWDETLRLGAWCQQCLTTSVGGRRAGGKGGWPRAPARFLSTTAAPACQSSASCLCSPARCSSSSSWQNWDQPCLLPPLSALLPLPRPGSSRCWSLREPRRFMGMTWSLHLVLVMVLRKRKHHFFGCIKSILTYKTELLRFRAERASQHSTPLHTLAGGSICRTPGSDGEGVGAPCVRGTKVSWMVFPQAVTSSGPDASLGQWSCSSTPGLVPEGEPHAWDGTPEGAPALKGFMGLKRICLHGWDISEGLWEQGRTRRPFLNQGEKA